MFRHNPKNIGYFVEKDHKNEFTYRLTNDAWAIEHGLLHEMDVGFCGESRFCNVKKTVVYVCVNEDNTGNPVVEKWNITKNVGCSFLD